MGSRGDKMIDDLAQCPFCTKSHEEYLFEDDSFFAIWDLFPVNEGHILIISKRHVRDLLSLTREEFSDLYEMIMLSKKEIALAFASPDGFNVGANIGVAAGQTVPHFHMHVIPRYTGDDENPRGGVRKVKRAIVPY